MNMKLNIRFVLIVAALCCLIAGCGGVRSTGFLDQPGSRGEVPLELPSRILMMPFDGDMKVSGWAMETVREKLYLFGFEVVDYQNVEDRICRDRTMTCDLTKPEHRQILVHEIGVDGVLRGTVSTSSKLTRIIGSIRLELLRTETGQILWIGSLDNQKWSVKSGEQKKNIERSITKLMKNLKKYIKKRNKQ